MLNFAAQMEMNPIAHKDIITDGDNNQIKYLFDHKKDARCLTQQVWFYVTLHFGIHGRELQCLLRKTDEHGAKYVKLGTDFAPKNTSQEELQLLLEGYKTWAKFIALTC